MANAVIENSNPKISMLSAIFFNKSPLNASTRAPATNEKSEPTNTPTNHSMIEFVNSAGTFNNALLLVS